MVSVCHLLCSSLSNCVVAESVRLIGQKEKNGVGPKMLANVARPYNEVGGVWARDYILWALCHFVVFV